METTQPLNSNFLSVTWPEWLFWGSLWVAMQPIAWLCMALQWIINQCDNDHAAIAELKKNLWDYVNAPGVKSIEELRAILRDCHVPAQYLTMLNNLLSVPEFLPHIREILAGANLQIKNHDAIQHIFASKFPRRSSHNYIPGQSWGISDRIVNQILIWNDQDGTFRMQLENSAFGDAILSSILHWINDWLKHVAIGKQIGPYGHSAFVDTKPIKITIVDNKPIQITIISP